jgi:two-component system sensor histidine kinase KdpD
MSPARPEPRPLPTPRPASWRGYAGTLSVVAACTVVAALMRRGFDLSNLTMVYLAGVVISAIAFGRGPAILAAFLSVAVFDFAFVPPRFTLRVSDTQYLFTFAVMLLVAAVIGTLTAWLREQLESARLREQRTAALYRLSHDLVARRTAKDVLTAAVDRVADVLGTGAAILLPDESGCVSVAIGDSGLFGGGEAERSAAQYAFDNAQIAGLDTRDLGGSRCLHLPLVASARVLGTLSVHSITASGSEGAERLQLLRAFANQTALALERCRLAETAERARTEAETERTRSALLSSISHDLRTPLAAITGAASSLRDDARALSEVTRIDLAKTIAEEAQRLNRLIGDLLDMTRLESGTLQVRKEWHSLEEVVGAALVRLESQLGDRPVRVAIPGDLPLVPLDDVLFEQVVRNLVENADKHAPAGQAIELSAVVDGRELRLEVADRGPGLGPGEESRVFEKFYRGPAATGRPGVGLGLAICQGIVTAHGGTIAAANRPGGGATFTIRLPIEGRAPTVEDEPPNEAPARSGR